MTETTSLQLSDESLVGLRPTSLSEAKPDCPKDKPVGDLSSEPKPEQVRQNWEQYKDKMTPQFYNDLWNSWCIKFNIDKKDKCFIELRNFINNQEVNNIKDNGNTVLLIKENDKTMVIKGLSTKKRMKIHVLCDKIGLHHESKSKEKHKRFLYIYKPNVWLWEYTEKNPFSESDEYYQKRQLLQKQKKQEEKINQKQKIQEKLRKLYCCLCDTKGSEAELFVSPYMSGLYCDECIETTSDGEGDLLSAHKFEPLYY